MTEAWLYREGPDLRWEVAASRPPWARSDSGDVFRVPLPPGLSYEHARTLLDYADDMAEERPGDADPPEKAAVRRVAEQLVTVAYMVLTKEEATTMACLLRARWEGAYTGADSSEGTLQGVALNLAERLEDWAGPRTDPPTDVVLPGWDGELALTLTDALWLRWALDEGDLEDDVLMLPSEADAPGFRSMHRELQRVVPRLEDALEALGSSRDGRCPDLPTREEDVAATPLSVLS